MKKIALNPDELHVTTFTTAETYDLPMASDVGSVERCSVTCMPSCDRVCVGTLNGAYTCHLDC